MSLHVACYAKNGAQSVYPLGGKKINRIDGLMERNQVCHGFFFSVPKNTAKLLFGLRRKLYYSSVHVSEMQISLGTWKVKDLNSL